jgi:hypothetical protein
MLPKRQFIETVAALRGINPEDGGLEDRGLPSHWQPNGSFFGD